MGEFVYFTEEQKQRAELSGCSYNAAWWRTGSCIPGKRESATRTEKAICTSRGEPDHAPCFCVSDKDKVCGS